jgi:hypothetical protein
MFHEINIYLTKLVLRYWHAVAGTQSFFQVGRTQIFEQRKVRSFLYER